MRSFAKYCLHFWVIVSLLAVVIFFLGTPRLSIKAMVLCYLVATVGYVLPMAFFFSLQTKPISRAFDGDTAEICARLDSDLKLKGHRVCVDDAERKKIYAYTLSDSSPFASMSLITRYLRWLTDDVIVTLGDSNVTVDGPRAIVDKLSV